MSFQAMAWAVEQQLPASKKIVLLMLANRVNSDTGKCVPRIKTLMQDCGLSESAVKVALRELTTLGLIKIHQRFYEGQQLPSQYELCLSGVVSEKHGGVFQKHRVGHQEATESGIESGIEYKQPSSNLADCPHQQLIDIFASKVPELPKPRIWTGKRSKDMAARWKWVMSQKDDSGQLKRTTQEAGIEFFAGFFDYIASSDFLTGRSGAWTKCDLPWLMKEENFAKVIEGNYENQGV